MKDQTNDTPQLPNWLTTRDEHAMPFRRETQEHLLARAKEDPRVIDIIARLEEKTERYIAEHPELNPYNHSSLRDSCPEWQWARRICRDPAKALIELHADAQFTLSEQHDIIRLAAYRQDYSFTNFFIEYAGKVSLPGDNSRKPAMPEEQARHYAESIRMIYPVACELQPKVALAYAPYVMQAMSKYGLEEGEKESYLSFAGRMPSIVLAQPDKFNNFRNKEDILATARKARAERAGDTSSLPVAETVAEATLKALETQTAISTQWGSLVTTDKAADASGWHKQ